MLIWWPTCLSYLTRPASPMRSATPDAFLVEAGAQMVKIEATRAYLDTVRAVSDAGIPVMAHIGILPQWISAIGRFRAEATTADAAQELVLLAEQMIQAGASALLIEGTAAEVAQIITERSAVPVISCGSGPDCDGQILVAPDILGLSTGPRSQVRQGLRRSGRPIRRGLPQVRRGDPSRPVPRLGTQLSHEGGRIAAPRGPAPQNDLTSGHPSPGRKPRIVRASIA